MSFEKVLFINLYKNGHMDIFLEKKSADERKAVGLHKQLFIPIKWENVQATVDDGPSTPESVNAAYQYLNHRTHSVQVDNRSVKMWDKMFNRGYHE
jgi:hypothetical protein